MLTNEAVSSVRPLARRPAHQSVYEQLRDLILFGELAPGQAVTIQGLTRDLGAGMTPVREAIRRMTSNGALSMQGNRRVIVPELTESCIEQLEFMRKNLEPELAHRAALRITPAAKDALKACDDALNKAIALGDIRGYLTQNYRFHSGLYAAADAPILLATTDRLWLRFGPSLRVVCGRFGTANLPDKHAELLEALAAGDPDAAARAVVGDVEQGMRQIREALRDI
ncbi:GntR family transcriptional regulator [uncultured Roseobacter sp.]|uniref:GntR family transcriptional regulator n=1 Tax=uncultured Roseobacter sp. TaxID=114847 RepID=UPI0026320DD1|nr:GntR family transcriptional regulator [uncultured Roseobacter sp.]